MKSEEIIKKEFENILKNHHAGADLEVKEMEYIPRRRSYKVIVAADKYDYMNYLPKSWLEDYIEDGQIRGDLDIWITNASNRINQKIRAGK